MQPSYDFQKAEAYQPKNKRVYQLILRDPISVAGLSLVTASFWYGLWKGIQGDAAKSTGALGGRAMMQAATVGLFASGAVFVRYLQRSGQLEKLNQEPSEPSLEFGGY